MSVYEVRFSSAAQGDLRHVPEPYRRTILDGIRDLGKNPRPQGSIKLSGNSGFHRLRVGPYRVGYEIRDREKAIRILCVAHRNEFYQIMRRR